MDIAHPIDALVYILTLVFSLMGILVLSEIFNQFRYGDFRIRENGFDICVYRWDDDHWEFVDVFPTSAAAEQYILEQKHANQ